MLLTLTIAPPRSMFVRPMREGARTLQRTHDVGVDEPRRLGVVGLHQGHEREQGRVVDENVEPVEALDRGGDDALAIRVLPNIRRDDEDRRAGLLADRRRSVRQPLFGAAGDGDARARAGEGAGDGEADARASPGHDRDLAGEVRLAAGVAHVDLLARFGERTLSRPPCGGGPGWGVAPNSGLEFIEARPQSHEPRADRIQNPVETAKDLIVGEAQDGVSLRREGSRTRSVSSHLVRGRVRRAVDLDHEPRVERSEAGDEAAKDDLSTKAESLYLLASKALPEAALSGGRIAPEGTCDQGQGLRHGATPHPSPPHKGGGNSSRPNGSAPLYQGVSVSIHRRSLYGIAWNRFASALMRLAVSMSRSVILCPASCVQNENETML